MKLISLIENTASTEKLLHEHGLSIYIETDKHRMLFDLGASDAFIHNAQSLGVDLAEIDSVVISHGHFDHGGGIEHFLRVNHKATLYLHQDAFCNHVLKLEEEHDIGLDSRFENHPRIQKTKDFQALDQNIFLFSGVSHIDDLPHSNRGLMRKQEGHFMPDPFSHEQNLVIHEKGVHLLLSGCSHNGILNILRKYRTLNSKDPDVFIGGFHLMSDLGMEAPENLDKLAAELLQTKTLFYTCHCTGLDAYAYLKRIMGDRLHYMAGGTILEF